MMVYLFRIVKNCILILFLAISSFLFAQERQLVLQNTHNSGMFSIRMADATKLKMKKGKSKIGWICGYTATSVCFKVMNRNYKEIHPKLRALSLDKSLTGEQRQTAFMNIFYPDSVYVPYDSIKKIKFTLADDKKYRFQTRFAYYLFLFLDVAMLAELSETGSSANPSLKNFNIVNVIIPVAYVASLINLDLALHKIIRTRDWKLKPVY